VAHESQLALPFAEPSAAAGGGFRVAHEVARLIGEIRSATARFAFVDPTRVAVAAARCRSRSRYGTFAAVYPLRFAGGSTSVVRGRTTWHLPRYVRGDRGMLYLLCVYVPRFFSLDPRARLGVIFHELFHMTDAFDGQLRKFSGYRSAHGQSVRHFESHFQAEVDAFVAMGRTRHFRPLLEYSVPRLTREYGGILAANVPRPRLLRAPSTILLD
jgi:hypothetical protein